MLKFFKNLFDEEKKKLGQYQQLVDEINNLESKLEKYSDEKLAAQTKKFKKKLKVGSEEFENRSKEEEQAVLEEILPEVFATVREVSKRVLGMRHFDVQMLAGIALHRGNITEQKTGEGKTLTVTCPLYLNALLGKGSHLITVNDYLAEIGMGWMSPIYHFLGMRTSVIVHERARLYNPDIDSEDRGDERLEHFEEIPRKDAYACDITYGTNNEFGFDYLRDNMVQKIEQMVQRADFPHYFTIVDEADSILIDEARTPLIISAPDSDPTKKYYDYAHMVKSLVIDQDYKIDEKAKSVTLTDLGVKRIEQKLGVSNLYEESFDTIHHVEAALKSSTLYHRDKEYIVRDKQVVIVDEHTGRLMFGRRYSDGLHQAIEAKEAVPIQQESRTLATVSIQNYFRLYQKLSGMTGTAVTESEEFNQIYKVDVLSIPTNVPVIREDKLDVVYKTIAAKYSAITKEVERVNKIGRPILIGTRSIDHNQIVASFLKRKKITHQVLNAKNNEKEAFVIADAGKKDAITVATNIAGRGVDIILGGAKPEQKDFKKKSEFKKAMSLWQKDHDEIVSLGGLHIIGTERHESRRIDNQLRGRSGRQGDPGSSQFFVALDDEIMRVFGGEQIKKIMDFLKIEEDQPIEHAMIGKSIESAQVKVEGFFFDQRKRLVEFDDVMNKHREIIYKRRRRLLELGSLSEGQHSMLSVPEGVRLKDQILEYIKSEIKIISHLEPEAAVRSFVKIIPFDDNSQKRLKEQIKKWQTPEEIEQELLKIAEQTYDSRAQVLGEDTLKELERLVVLSTVDEKWMEHLDEMDSLREGIWLRGDKSTVLSEYKKEAFSMFDTLVGSMESTITQRIFRVHPVERPITSRMPDNISLKKDSIHESITKEVADATPPSANRATSTKGSAGDLASVLGQAKGGAKPQPGSSKVKIGRNDLCPCGSGLKYKKCGLVDASEHKG
jgi:preprotein translocase subunit SecA